MSDMSMEDLKAGMCRWPFGDPEDKNFHFCGNPCDYALSYCEEHMTKAKAPVRKARSA